MNKDELIFDWKNVEAHPLGKLVAVVVIGLVFAMFASLFTIRFGSPEAASPKSASVLFFPDQKTGRIWLMKAEEEGPFPGGLEIAGLRESMDLIGSDTLGGLGAWNEYSISLKQMKFSDNIVADQVSSKGLRFFPQRVRNGEILPEGSAPVSEAVLKPVLIPYTDEAVKWLPDELPVFDMPAEERVASASWRFVLNLRSNGSVAQCLSLSGGNEASLKSMIDWLESLRFEKSEQDSRWMGLRVEFLNEADDGTDPR
jgi:hypothetical protein